MKTVVKSAWALPVFPLETGDVKAVFLYYNYIKSSDSF